MCFIRNNYHSKKSNILVFSGVVYVNKIIIRKKIKWTSFLLVLLLCVINIILEQDGNDKVYYIGFSFTGDYKLAAHSTCCEN
jgi:hypothetical protein